MEVRTRSLRRQAGLATITHVGAQLEPITQALRPLANSQMNESGLPVSINVPTDLKLLPGEIVDVVLNPRTSKN